MDRNATSFDIDNNYTPHSTKETTDHDYYQREYTYNHLDNFSVFIKRKKKDKRNARTY